MDPKACSHKHSLIAINTLCPSPIRHSCPQFEGSSCGNPSGGRSGTVATSQSQPTARP